MKKIYRPDIDALRGVAVLSVLFYHAKFSFFSQKLFIGGFLGVDIFFVLTGFLITTMLVSEFEENKTINILNFYIRRVRRLIPALLVVMVISTFFSYFLLDPVKIKEFSQSVYYSLVFLPNFYFHYFGNFYGAQVNLSKPLLHLWSLGVEEQFYIFYPLFLIITFKYFKKFIQYFLFLGFFISLLFAEYASTDHEMFSFYMLPSRAWEIILGSLLGYFLIQKKDLYTLPEKLSNFLYLISIVTIIYFIFIFDIYRLKHPSSITLIPLLAVSTIILLGHNSKNFFFFRIFTNKFLIFFGKISYSLYLYHFIIFSFYRNSYLEENTITKILLIFISIIISYFSYIYVEQVFRNKSLSVKNLIYFIAIFTFGILTFNSYIFFNKKLLDGDYLVDGVRITEWHDTEKIRKEHKIFNQESFADNGNSNVLITGNCHSVDIYMSLYLNKDRFKNHNFSQMSSDFYQFESIIKNNHPKYKSSDIIIFSTRWENNNITEKNLSKLPELIKKIKKDKKKIILMSSIPEFEYKKHKFKLRKVEFTNYKKNLASSKTTNLSSSEIDALKKKYYLDYKNNKRIVNINNRLKTISVNNNIQYVDLVDLLCDKKSETCEFRLEKSKDELFRDYGRYSYRGLKHIGFLLSKKNILHTIDN